jgi:hypothetical protein
MFGRLYGFGGAWLRLGGGWDDLSGSGEMRSGSGEARSGDTSTSISTCPASACDAAEVSSFSLSSLIETQGEINDWP